MAVVLVLLGTIGNALAITLQRKAAQDSARQRGVSAGSLGDMIRRPAWILGICIFAVALSFQVLALSLGSVALVQPVLVMELPFTLLVGWWVLGGALRAYEWIAVATLSAGLVILLASLRPHGGDALGAGTGIWLVGSVVTFAILGLAVTVARRSGRAGRAAFYGIAAGIGSGFMAVLFKVMTEALAREGIVGVLTTWQTYLVLPAAPAAFLTLQYALRSGRLLASQPGLTLGNPLLASLWGIGLLGEQIADGFSVLGGLVGAAVLTTGVFLLARSPVLAAQEGGRYERGASAGTSGRRPI